MKNNLKTPSARFQPALSFDSLFEPVKLGKGLMGTDYSQRACDDLFSSVWRAFGEMEPKMTWVVIKLGDAVEMSDQMRPGPTLTTHGRANKPRRFNKKIAFAFFAGVAGLGPVVALTGCGDKTPSVATNSVSVATAPASVTEITASQTPSSAVPETPTTLPTVPVPDGPPTTINVPGDAPTIQAGVDKAKPGDLVLVGPGVYNEAIFVRTEGVVVRGIDRNSVILDGMDKLENGITVSGNGVAIENLTVHNYVINGIVFTKKYEDNADGLSEEEVILKGYRASYVTAYNNGLYGLYAFYARNGQMDNSYVSGNPDGGIYIGQCNPCNAVITNIVGERNAIGFLGTNASGNLSVINSVWRKNKIGMLAQSEDSEFLAPQKDVLLAGNLVEDNNGAEAPAYKSWGYGIVIGGGQNNRVTRNRIRGNNAVGIFVTELAQYLPVANRVSENTLSANGVDLAYGASSAKTGPWAGGQNCFEQNRFASSTPSSIETALPCDAKEHSIETSPIVLQSPPGDVDYRNVTNPVSQPSMPDARTAEVKPAVDLPVAVDVNSIKLPQ
jgi:Right handed beta helix region